MKQGNQDERKDEEKRQQMSLFPLRVKQNDRGRQVRSDFDFVKKAAGHFDHGYFNHGHFDHVHFDTLICFNGTK